MKLLKWFRACRKISYRHFLGFRLVSVAVISRSAFGTNSGFILQYRNFEHCKKKHSLTSAEYAQHVCDQLLFRESFFFLSWIHFLRILRPMFPKFKLKIWCPSRVCFGTFVVCLVFCSHRRHHFSTLAKSYGVRWRYTIVHINFIVRWSPFCTFTAWNMY